MCDVMGGKVISADLRTEELHAGSDLMGVSSPLVSHSGRE